MSQRYGGKFSPDGSGPVDDEERGTVTADRGTYRDARRTKAGGRVNLLFLAPLPLIWQAFGNGASALALNLIALGTLLLAAWLTREGIIAQEAYEARKVARRPGFPRKIAASALTGLGLGIAGFASDGSLAAPIIYALVGGALHSFAFGLDPMKNKGMEGVDLAQTDRVARVVDRAEQHLKAMSDAVIRSGDRQAEGRVERFQVTVRDMLRTVEDDPRDLTAARRYLGVYLKGATDATVKFADIYARSQDKKARADYLSLLSDMETNFTAKTRKLLADNNADLEIEISVLRDRLGREGIHLDT